MADNIIYSTPESAYDHGCSLYKSGHYDEAIEYFRHVYYETDDDTLREKANEYMDKCYEEREKERKEEEKRNEQYSNELRTGINYLNIAKSDRNVRIFEEAKFYFGRAYNYAPDTESEQECEDYIHECNEWIDSIMYRNDD